MLCRDTRNSIQRQWKYREGVYLVKQHGNNITGSDISVAHRLAPPNDSNKNPAIIVKFLSQKLRDTIYHKRWKLKDINNKTGNDGFKVFIMRVWRKQVKKFKAALSFKMRFHYVTFCYVNSSVKMKNAPLLAYYQSYSFNLTSIINHQWRKSFTSAK